MIDLTYSYITLERKREGTHKLKATIRVKRKREERNDGVTAVRYVLINNIILHKRLGTSYCTYVMNSYRERCKILLHTILCTIIVAN